MENDAQKQAFLIAINSAFASVSEADIKKIEAAYDFAKEAHKDQTRLSGRDYFSEHCLGVASHVIDLDIDDAVLISAALLHDVIEDTDVTEEELSSKFGAEICELVLGVSKLDKVQYLGNERHVESLRRFFVSVAQDLRVVILKLADRWHNLETLQYLPAERQQHVALESIMIFAPLASRLGMGKLFGVLNDLAFPYAYPEQYKKTKELMDNQLKKSSTTITKMYRDLSVDLYNSLAYQPVIDKRVKSVYSLFKKLERYKWDVELVYDLVALRSIVKNVNDCYQALGAVHDHWKPIPHRIKDFIAVPKPNGYRSLHTTVFSGDGLMVEIQIRTEEMHEFDEYGIASHHGYKISQLNTANQESFAWINQLREFQKDDISPSEYLKLLGTDFVHNRIFVFTPKGDVIDMPEGATILDFAFAIHSEIGEHASGGRVNGKYMALKTPLVNEDIVEVVTNNKTHPTDKWLDQCVTTDAQNRIRRFVKKTHEFS